MESTMKSYAPALVLFAVAALMSCNKNGSPTNTDNHPQQLLDTKSQLIQATQGGAITLNDGSTVTIGAGALQSDATVTLSLVAALPKQPPSGLIIGVGPALILSLTKSGSPKMLAKTASSSGTIDLVIRYSSDTISGLAGSAPMADVVDLSGNHRFVGIPGSYSSNANAATLSLPTGLVQDAKEVYLSSANVNPMVYEPPPRFGGRIWNSRTQRWLDYPQTFDPTKKTLVLEHGVNSTIEEAYGGCVDQIMSAGGYEQVIGFNYDWTKRPAATGKQLAAFLDTLKTAGLAEADIEAHSFGTITALAAVSRTGLTVPHMVLEGGPLNGTPLAEHPNYISLMAYYLNGVNKLTYRTLDTLFASGLLDDLAPGSSVLSGIKSDAKTIHPETEFIKVVGQTCTDLPDVIQRDMYGGSLLVNTANSNDCFIPATSAAGSDLPGPPAMYFPLQHDKIECDPEVIQNVGIALRAPLNCGYQLSSPGQGFTAAGGSGSLQVTSPNGCPWTATTTDPWISVTSGSSGSGNGTVNFSVQANASTSQRMGRITVADSIFQVAQIGAAGQPGPFDGVWSGIIAGTFTNPTADPPTWPYKSSGITDTLTLTVVNSTLVKVRPFGGKGTLDAAGKIAWYMAVTFSWNFSGTLRADGTASGTWVSVDSQLVKYGAAITTGIGTWTAKKQ
jgi:hypothetical protein